VKKKLLIIITALFALVLLFMVLKEKVFAPSQSNTGNGQNQTQKPDFNKKAYSTTRADSIWVIVSKVSPIKPSGYVPGDLVTPEVALRSSGQEMMVRKQVAAALENMFTAAKKDNINLMLASGFRTYELQQSVYQGEVSRFGQAVADTQSARPGHSEHQTGLVADLADAAGTCVVDDCFAQTPEGKWLAKNAHKYGFIQRYVPGKEAITGYRSESWHYRFVGKSLAVEMKTQNISTLEEFFDVVPSAQPW
jgi:D-alanyl-D-alanine carboxypeptidase